MTAVTTTTTVRLPADPGSAPIPFGRLVRTELRKLTDTRAGRWLLIATAALTVGVMIGMLIAAPTRDLTYNKFADFTSTPQKMLLPALGILAMTSEWSQRTGLVTFTLEPRRGRVLRAKIAASLALALAVAATVFATSAVGTLLGQAFRHSGAGWAFGASGFGSITLVLLIMLLEGIAFGMALLIPAAAIIAYYVVPTLWSALFSSASMKRTAPWIDLNQATGALYNHQITGEGWIQLLAAVALWVGLPFAIGVRRVRRAEVK